MKLTGRVPIGNFALTARPGRLTAIAAALVLILSAAGCSVTSAAPTSTAPVTASPEPAPGVTAYGNDISWPQCPEGGGGYGLPGPMASASFVVLGLTDGSSFQANPCLARQVASAKTHRLRTGAYATSSYPTREQMTRYSGTGTLPVRLGRVGAAQAVFNLTTMARVGLRSPMVWVDVEPSTRTPWSASAGNNNAVIDGAIARYQAAGLEVGIYSYSKVWRAITGGRLMPGTPTWVPVGDKGKAMAAATCAMVSYAGKKPWLTQWTDGVRDYNLTCPGVTGWAASGNLLTPYLNVALASGSLGAAVTALRRRLGGLTATGAFDPATRTKVVAFQRARHMTADGIVGIAVWRALGAGTGTYTPPMRGFMGALFASS